MINYQHSYGNLHVKSKSTGRVYKVYGTFTDITLSRPRNFYRAVDVETGQLYDIPENATVPIKEPK